MIAFFGDWDAGNISADFNHDGFVNGDDYDAFASAFESAHPSADFNADGFSDFVTSAPFLIIIAGLAVSFWVELRYDARHELLAGLRRSQPAGAAPATSPTEPAGTSYDTTTSPDA